MLITIPWTGIASTYAFVVNCAGNEGVSVLVGKFVLKLLVPDHTLLKDGLTNDCALRQVKLTISFVVNAVIVVVGILVLKLFVPVQELLFAWIADNADALVVKFWAFKQVN